MIPFWKKTDKHSKPQSAQKRRQNAKPAVPRTAQQSIPMQRMFEDGTCRVKPNYYTRTIQYQDINYQLAQQEDKTAIFEEWCSFLNFFDSSIKFELSFVNMATDSTEFEKSIRIPFQKDGFDEETFKKQYKLTTWVEVQTRYMTVWVMTPAGIPVPTQVPYEYRIFHTKLVNRGLEVVIREELNNDQWKRYEIFQDTLGGRPYLFNGGLPPGGSDGSGAPGIDYQIPAEALTDSEFAAIYEEAKKYVGMPYVWGGSTPETGFDCSGYVCWVYNQNGYDVGRTTANGLWNKSQHISEAEAKPGDLVFFKGTYDTPGMSHTGIYLGNGMMVSAGDPIKYANIHLSYWEKRSGLPYQ